MLQCLQDLTVLHIPGLLDHASDNGRIGSQGRVRTVSRDNN
jgi:hypothetical protein